MNCLSISLKLLAHHLLAHIFTSIGLAHDQNKRKKQSNNYFGKQVECAFQSEANARIRPAAHKLKKKK